MSLIAENYKMRKVFAILFTVMLVAGCSNNNKFKVEVHQNKWDKVVTYDKAINDINIELFLGKSQMSFISNFLLLTEFRPSYTHTLHLFDKNTFKHVTSAGIVGRGPGEVTRTGKPAINHFNNDIWLSDHGKQLMWRFPLDSIIKNKDFLPTESIVLKPDTFMVHPFFLNDSTIIGRAARIIDNNSFEMLTAKLNINTNKTTAFGYQHPVAKGKRLSTSTFGLSLKDSIYVIAHDNVDLITICNLDGSLLRNVYGPQWEQSLKDYESRMAYYAATINFYKKHIIVGYIGSKSIVFDKQGMPMGSSPTFFHVFDIKGNYKTTLDLKQPFSFSCIDSDNERLIVYFEDRENPYGFINLSSLIKS